MHSKIAISVTACLIVSGMIAFLLFEYNNPLTIQGYSFAEKIEASFFQSVTTRTAGFATIPQENLTDSSAIVSLILMFIGGSPVGTAGGIKTVTFLVLVATAISVIRNRRSANVFGRQIAEEAIRKAVGVFVMSFCVVAVSTILLSYVTNSDFMNVIYETVSATATVGLTRNLTPSLNTSGKLIITIAMFLGRVGPISLAVALNKNKGSENIVSNPVEDIVVG